ncbi:unnamed protein product [Gordionus sp. m RMFG-2023]
MACAPIIIDKRPLKKPKIGPPDIYPQELKQREDDLSAVNVKQGFFDNPPFIEEYGSGKSVKISHETILNSFNNINKRKKEINTSIDNNKKKLLFNIKDIFWPATARSKISVDAWFKDLTANKPLNILAKKVPIFNKKEELFMQLYESNVPVQRACWIIKLHAVHIAAIAENKMKKRQVLDPYIDWTQVLCKVLKELASRLLSLHKKALAEEKAISSLDNSSTELSSGVKLEHSSANSHIIPIPITTNINTSNMLLNYNGNPSLPNNNEFYSNTKESSSLNNNEVFAKFSSLDSNPIHNSSSSSSMTNLATVIHGNESQVPLYLSSDLTVTLNIWNYLDSLVWYLFTEGLLDNQELLTFICDLLEKSVEKYDGELRDEALDFLLPFILKYMNTFCQSYFHCRRLVYFCVTVLCEYINVSDTISDNSADDEFSFRFHDCLHHRNAILNLSNIIRTATLRCPSSLVWNGVWDWTSSLTGSPLDKLPIEPSKLPTPNYAGNYDSMKNALLDKERLIKKRSTMAENLWALGKNKPSCIGKVINVIIDVLHALDHHDYNKCEKDNCLKSLYDKIFSPFPHSYSHSSQDLIRLVHKQEEPVIFIMCQWAITLHRSGAHRSLVIANLFAMRLNHLDALLDDNSDMSESGFNEEEEGGLACNPKPLAAPILQKILIKFLDLYAPILSENNPSMVMFSNLVIFFGELIRLNIFDYDGYIKILICRGDLDTSDLRYPAWAKYMSSKTLKKVLSTIPNKPTKENQISFDKTNNMHITDSPNVFIHPFALAGFCSSSLSLTSPFTPSPASPNHPSLSRNPNCNLHTTTEENFSQNNNNIRAFSKHYQYLYHFPVFASRDVTTRRKTLFGIGHMATRVKRDIDTLSSAIIPIRVPLFQNTTKHNSTQNPLDVLRVFSCFPIADKWRATTRALKFFVATLRKFADARSDLLPCLRSTARLFELAHACGNHAAITNAASDALLELAHVHRHVIDAIKAVRTPIGQQQSHVNDAAIMADWGFYPVKLCAQLTGTLRFHFSRFVTLAQPLPNIVTFPNGSENNDVIRVFRSVLAFCREIGEVPQGSCSFMRSIYSFVYDLWSSCYVLREASPSWNKVVLEVAVPLMAEIKRTMYGIVAPAPSPPTLHHPWWDPFYLISHIQYWSLASSAAPHNFKLDRASFHDSYRVVASLEDKDESYASALGQLDGHPSKRYSFVCNSLLTMMGRLVSDPPHLQHETMDIAKCGSMHYETLADLRVLIRFCAEVTCQYQNPKNLAAAGADSLGFSTAKRTNKKNNSLKHQISTSLDSSTFPLPPSSIGNPPLFNGEWLGAFKALCCPTHHMHHQHAQLQHPHFQSSPLNASTLAGGTSSVGYNNFVVVARNLTKAFSESGRLDKLMLFYDALATLCLTLVLRHIFSLEDFIKHVALPSLLAAACPPPPAASNQRSDTIPANSVLSPELDSLDENGEHSNPITFNRPLKDIPAESGARLTCYLLYRLFKSFPASRFTDHTDPRDASALVSDSKLVRIFQQSYCNNTPENRIKVQNTTQNDDFGISINVPNNVFDEPTQATNNYLAHSNNSDSIIMHNSHEKISDNINSASNSPVEVSNIKVMNIPYDIITLLTRDITTTQEPTSNTILEKHEDELRSFADIFDEMYERQNLISYQHGISIGALLAVFKALILTSSISVTDSVSNSERRKRVSKFKSRFGKTPDPDSVYNTYWDFEKVGEILSLRFNQFSQEVLLILTDQEWVKELFLKDPDGICSDQLLLDPLLSHKQAFKLLHLICYPDGGPSSSLPYPPYQNARDRSDPVAFRQVSRVLANLDHWSLRASYLELRLAIKQRGARESDAAPLYEALARSAVQLFQRRSQFNPADNLPIRYGAATFIRNLFRAEVDEYLHHDPHRQSSYHEIDHQNDNYQLEMINKVPIGKQGRPLKEKGVISACRSKGGRGGGGGANAGQKRRKRGRPPLSATSGAPNHKLNVPASKNSWGSKSNKRSPKQPPLPSSGTFCNSPYNIDVLNNAYQDDDVLDSAVSLSSPDSYSNLHNTTSNNNIEYDDYEDCLGSTEPLISLGVGPISLLSTGPITPRQASPRSPLSVSPDKGVGSSGPIESAAGISHAEIRRNKQGFYRGVLGGKRKREGIWLVAPLISKLPAGVQGRVLKYAGQVLESGAHWATSSLNKLEREKNAQRSASLLNHGPFLLLVRTCLARSKALFLPSFDSFTTCGNALSGSNSTLGPDASYHNPFNSDIATSNFAPLSLHDSPTSDQRHYLLSSIHTQLTTLLRTCHDDRHVLLLPENSSTRNELRRAFELRLSIVAEMIDLVINASNSFFSSCYNSASVTSGNALNSLLGNNAPHLDSSLGSSIASMYPLTTSGGSGGGHNQLVLDWCFLLVQILASDILINAPAGPLPDSDLETNTNMPYLSNSYNSDSDSAEDLRRSLLDTFNANENCAPLYYTIFDILTTLVTSCLLLSPPPSNNVTNHVSSHSPLFSHENGNFDEGGPNSLAGSMTQYHCNTLQGFAGASSTKASGFGATIKDGPERLLFVQLDEGQKKCYYTLCKKLKKELAEKIELEKLEMLKILFPFPRNSEKIVMFDQLQDKTSHSQSSHAKNQVIGLKATEIVTLNPWELIEGLPKSMGGASGPLSLSWFNARKTASFKPLSYVSQYESLLLHTHHLVGAAEFSHHQAFSLQTLPDASPPQSPTLLASGDTPAGGHLILPSVSLRIKEEPISDKSESIVIARDIKSEFSINAYEACNIESSVYPPSNPNALLIAENNQRLNPIVTAAPKKPKQQRRKRQPKNALPSSTKASSAKQNQQAQLLQLQQHQNQPMIHNHPLNNPPKQQIHSTFKAEPPLLKVVHTSAYTNQQQMGSAGNQQYLIRQHSAGMMHHQHNMIQKKPGFTNHNMSSSMDESYERQQQAYLNINNPISGVNSNLTDSKAALSSMLRAKNPSHGPTSTSNNPSFAYQQPLRQGIDPQSIRYPPSSIGSGPSRFTPQTPRPDNTTQYHPLHQQQQSIPNNHTLMANKPRNFGPPPQRNMNSGDNLQYNSHPGANPYPNYDNSKMRQQHPFNDKYRFEGVLSDIEGYNIAPTGRLRYPQPSLEQQVYSNKTSNFSTDKNNNQPFIRPSGYNNELVGHIHPNKVSGAAFNNSNKQGSLDQSFDHFDFDNEENASKMFLSTENIAIGLSKMHQQNVGNEDYTKHMMENTPKRKISMHQNSHGNIKRPPSYSSSVTDLQSDKQTMIYHHKPNNPLSRFANWSNNNPNVSMINMNNPPNNLSMTNMNIPANNPNLSMANMNNQANNSNFSILNNSGNNSNFSTANINNLANNTRRLPSHMMAAGPVPSQQAIYNFDPNNQPSQHQMQQQPNNNYPSHQMSNRNLALGSNNFHPNMNDPASIQRMRYPNNRGKNISNNLSQGGGSGGYYDDNKNQGGHYYQN